MTQRVEHRSGSDNWCTPPEVLDRVARVNLIGLDPCWNPSSLTATDPYASEHFERFTEREDGIRSWSGYGLVFVNPPYSQLRQQPAWVSLALLADEAIVLVKAAPDTAWFQPMWQMDALAFWRGRLRFLGAPSAAPFPSVLGYKGPRPLLFDRAFRDVATIVYPRIGIREP